MLKVPRRVFSFTDWMKQRPREPIPGDRIDLQFEELISAITATQRAIADIRADDGKLKRGIVTDDNLSLRIRDEAITGIRAEIEPIRSSVKGIFTSTVASEHQAELYARDAEAAAAVAAQLTSGMEAIRRQAVSAADAAARDASITGTDATDAENWGNYALAQADNAELAANLSLQWAEYLAGPVVDSANAPAYIAGTPFPYGLYYQPVEGGLAGLWSAKWWALWAQQLVGKGAFYYLGGSATPPTPGGQNPNTGQPYPNPIAPGSLYYNTVSNTLYVWNGQDWVKQQLLTAGVAGTYLYYATAGQTAFSGPDANGQTPNVGTSPSIVHVNGDRLTSAQFTVNSTTSTLTLANPSAAGDAVIWDLLLPASSGVNIYKVIAFSPDGTITDFPIQYNAPSSGAPTNALVGSNAELVVVLDGVEQEPGTDYTTSNNGIASTLHMVVAPAADSDFWAEWYEPGVPGPPGRGVPAGGSAGQVLAKNSSADYDTVWAPAGVRYGFVNIKDFGAVGDGVTNDSAAFKNFNTWGRAQTTAVTLYIPPGSYAGIGVTNGGYDFFVGIKDITVWGYGATIPALRGCNGLYIGTGGGGTVFSQIQTVTGGSTTVTLNTLSDTSKWSVGQWVCVSSLEMQGSGFPPNFYYFDYVQIKAINTSTGVITFYDPVVFTHKSTYPDTTVPPASDTHAYPGARGGPASIFALVPEWDAHVRIYGLTVSGSDGSEIILTMRRVHCVDCTFIYDFAPSCSMFSIFDNCAWPGNPAAPGSGEIEVDKNVTHLELNNCRIGLLWFQSASVDAVIDGCVVDTLNWAPKNLRIRDSSIGKYSFLSPSVGANRTTNIENCRIGSISLGLNTNYMLLSDLTFSNGTFSIPLSSAKALNFYRLAIPGSKCLFNSNSFIYNLGNPFLVLSVYQDATNIYMDTTLTALPSYSGTGTAAPGISQHHAPRLIAGNITGSDQAIMLGKQPAELPALSYAHKVYSEDLIQPGINAVTQAINQWGNFVQLKINVIRADTGPNGTLTFNPLNRNGALVLNTATNATIGWNPAVNLKTAGVRTITQSTVTGNVAGDTLTAPGAIWFIGSALQPTMSANISSDTPAQMPIVEVELITDQGITALEYTVQ